MTQYRFISDLHTELWLENTPKALKQIDRLLPPLTGDAATVLLLAGDTGSFRRRNLYKLVIDRLCDRFLAVIDIPGNHFWYGRTDWDVMSLPFHRDNYRFGSTLAAFGVVAATLWTDFRGGDPVIEQQCADGMNDFKQIPFLTPDMVEARHFEHVQFLRHNVTPGGIVMTHFAPSQRSIPDDDRGHPCSGYYASDLEGLIEDLQPALWLHGHIHERSDYLIGRTRVLCNPAGYEGRNHDPVMVF